MPVKWNGAAVLARVQAELGRRLDACAILVTNHAKELLSVDGTGKRTALAKRDKQGRFLKRKSSLVYGANPSRPGEPPHLQTGRLRASVAWARAGLVARVGTNVPYGAVLETKMDRPWLVRSLADKTPQVHRLLTAPLGSFTNPIDVTP